MYKTDCKASGADNTYLYKYIIIGTDILFDEQEQNECLIQAFLQKTNGSTEINKVVAEGKVKLEDIKARLGDTHTVMTVWSGYKVKQSINMLSPKL